MQIQELATKADIESAKAEIISLLQKLTSKPDAINTSGYLRTRDVVKLLKVSPNKLKMMRMNKEIPFTKVGKTFFYPANGFQNL